MAGCFDFMLPLWWQIRRSRSRWQRETRTIPVRVVPLVQPPSPTLLDRLTRGGKRYRYRGPSFARQLYHGKRTKLQAFEVRDGDLPRGATATWADTGRLDISLEDNLRRQLLLISDEGNRMVWDPKAKITSGITVHEYFFRKPQKHSEKYLKKLVIKKFTSSLMEFAEFDAKLTPECMQEIQAWLNSISNFDGNIMIRTLVSDDPDDVAFRQWQATRKARRVPTEDGPLEGPSSISPVKLEEQRRTEHEPKLPELSSSITTEHRADRQAAQQTNAEHKRSGIPTLVVCASITVQPEEPGSIEKCQICADEAAVREVNSPIEVATNEQNATKEPEAVENNVLDVTIDELLDQALAEFDTTAEKLAAEEVPVVTVAEPAPDQNDDDNQVVRSRFVEPKVPRWFRKITGNFFKQSPKNQPDIVLRKYVDLGEF